MTSSDLTTALRAFARWLYGLYVDVRDFWCGGPPDEDERRGFEVVPPREK
jgi:hypothetical protein